MVVALGVSICATLVRRLDLAVAVEAVRRVFSSTATPGPQFIRDATLRTIHSDFGHDGFLIEADQLGPIVTEFLDAG